MSLDRALPKRVLVVDDDELIRDTVTGILRAADFEVTTADDGAQALTVFGREWFPVVVTDRNMPAMDGIEFVSRLRVIALAPVYVIMLTVSADVQDQERGYCAGVDLYVPKQGYENELAARVVSGVGAIRRRRSVGTGQNSGAVTVDLEAGAHTARHLVGRLHAEILSAGVTKLPLHVISVCIEGDDSIARRQVSTQASDALLAAVHGALRPKLDWVTRLPVGRNACRLAITMPQSQAGDVAAVEQGIRNAFSKDDTGLRGFRLTIGNARLADSGTPPTALELLGQSDRNRRATAAQMRDEPAGVSAVQPAPVAAA